MFFKEFPGHLKGNSTNGSKRNINIFIYLKNSFVHVFPDTSVCLLFSNTKIKPRIVSVTSTLATEHISICVFSEKILENVPKSNKEKRVKKGSKQRKRRTRSR